ncbi:hypothetical protein [Caballeronia sp. J97]|uniref:hypothetical protein n=1 Tax=Caballeronia sp. J97 TaxID=2805429 RepID=UPI002AB322B5|nr:hypothetical protein [Caballeronia sp. J97]
MSTAVCRRHAVVACFVACAGAIVCGCSKPDASSSSSVDASNNAPFATPASGATSELQDWAQQATGGASDRSARPAMARAASEPLATPVIHSVD